LWSTEDIASYKFGTTCEVTEECFTYLFLRIQERPDRVTHLFITKRQSIDLPKFFKANNTKEQSNLKRLL